MSVLGAEPCNTFVAELLSVLYRGFARLPREQAAGIGLVKTSVTKADLCDQQERRMIIDYELVERGRMPARHLGTHALQDDEVCLELEVVADSGAGAALVVFCVVMPTYLLPPTEGEPRLSMRCHACDEAAGKKRCAACHMAWYCSADCQKAAWPLHRRHCKQLARAAESASALAGDAGQ